MAEITVNEAVSRFQQLIKVKTVSAKDGNFDREEFARFLPLLKELYADAFSVVEAELINEFGILLRWKGKTASNPMVLMAHHDVVSDEGQEWEHPAFEAEIHNDCVWGRGTIDTKCIIAAILEGINNLVKEGFVPERDIYFASSNCEEVAGDTMPKIVEAFEERGIQPGFVLDEGGAIMSSLPMGIKTPFAMIALSEKGWATLRLTAKAKNAAHGAKATSAGDKVSAPVKLVRALSKLDSSPSKATITPALEGMLQSFAPYVSGPLNKVFENVAYLKPIIKKAMESNADTAAMIRSAIIINGYEATPVNGATPETATATVKVRIAPQDTLDEILDHIKKVAGKDITVEVTDKSEPPKISDYKTEAFDYIKETVKKVFPDVGVSPFILNAGTDSRHFAKICDRIYRFGAFRLDDELFATVHSANERMPIKDYLKMVEFYTELMKNLK
ncbi:MAG: M20/M25/M40 family metallo-hydrolase [Clostridia bacterium]|nr:M20/M25/M40 family metallo-hydrolase [Clostridia bacterium]